jgi:uroporphyrinogen decarboxylase
MSALADLILDSPGRVAVPIAVYPGVALTGARTRDVVTSARAQFEAAAALHEHFRTPVVLSAMDLSAEAEAFGCEIRLSDDEVPTVVGRRVTTADEAAALPVPEPGAGRTWVYLETVRLLKRLPDRPLVLAGCIGPFSLAARLAGMSEACRYTLTDPGLMHRLVDRSTEFLSAYVKAFQAVGADGVLMAEPAAGLLSPRGLAAFSSAYIKRIAAVEDGHFALVLHNCAARLPHLPAILESGVRLLHFGPPMDLPAALAAVGPDIILCGNLDPVAVFVQGTPAEVAERTRALLSATDSFDNFVASSGCDVPPTAPLANLETFFHAVQASRRRQGALSGR